MLKFSYTFVLSSIGIPCRLLYVKVTLCLFLKERSLIICLKIMLHNILFVCVFETGVL
jgi:hypothetical protein